MYDACHDIVRATAHVTAASHRMRRGAAVGAPLLVACLRGTDVLLVHKLRQARIYDTTGDGCQVIYGTKLALRR